jgi:protein DGCR14
MFEPDSVEEAGFTTIMEAREASSKAGPKETVFKNTRFPPIYMVEDPGPIPASPSLNTSIIARRDATRANRAQSESTYTGEETPRVNGYSFVDEDEPEPDAFQEPTYRDLLAGQTGDSTPNPFTIHSRSTREDLHHRLVEKDSIAKRKRDKETAKPSSTLEQGGQTPMGNMTPAARKLMQKLGRTPLPHQSVKVDRVSHKEMWTPGSTPRRSRV